MANRNTVRVELWRVPKLVLASLAAAAAATVATQALAQASPKRAIGPCVGVRCLIYSETYDSAYVRIAGVRIYVDTASVYFEGLGAGSAATDPFSRPIAAVLIRRNTGPTWEAGPGPSGLEQRNFVRIDCRTHNAQVVFYRTYVNGFSDEPLFSFGDSEWLPPEAGRVSLSMHLQSKSGRAGDVIIDRFCEWAHQDYFAEPGSGR